MLLISWWKAPNFTPGALRSSANQLKRKKPRWVLIVSSCFESSSTSLIITQVDYAKIPTPVELVKYVVWNRQRMVIGHPEQRSVQYRFLFFTNFLFYYHDRSRVMIPSDCSRPSSASNRALWFENGFGIGLKIKFNFHLIAMFETMLEYFGQYCSTSFNLTYLIVCNVDLVTDWKKKTGSQSSTRGRTDWTLNI